MGDRIGAIFLGGRKRLRAPKAMMKDKPPIGKTIEEDAIDRPQPAWSRAVLLRVIRTPLSVNPAALQPSHFDPNSKPGSIPPPTRKGASAY